MRSVMLRVGGGIVSNVALERLEVSLLHFLLGAGSERVYFALLTALCLHCSSSER